MKNQKAIYSLSADPMTFGHINIVERSANSFDTIIVAIGDNSSKKYLLTKEERLQVARDSLSHIKNVEVVLFDGLLVDFAFLNNVNVIIRGLRNIEDFQYEQDLNGVNNSILKSIDTFYLLAEPSKFHISSSTAKVIVSENVFSQEYLSLSAKSMLEDKINNQIFIGVTGLVGCGKSYLSQKLVEHSSEFSKFNIHNIDIDLLAHKIYEEDNPLFIKIRSKIKSEFGTLDRSKIGNIVFNDSKKLDFLNDIFIEPLDFLIRQAVKGLEGIILLNGATIVSDKFLPICNNNILFVDASNKTRKERCMSHRNMTSLKFDEIESVMVSNRDQLDKIKSSIEKHNYGNILRIANNSNLDISSVFASILEKFTKRTK
jgi:pantetheine-phosphate adenylyltransferase